MFFIWAFYESHLFRSIKIVKGNTISNSLDGLFFLLRTKIFELRKLSMSFRYYLILCRFESRCNRKMTFNVLILLIVSLLLSTKFLSFFFKLFIRFISFSPSGMRKIIDLNLLIVSISCQFLNKSEMLDWFFNTMFSKEFRLCLISGL